jgi:hypothetical protein
LNRIYYQQFPNGLPHNGLGVKYARYMCRTMAFLPDDRRAEWLAENAAWIDPSTRDYVLSLGAYWYSDRSLGQHLELYDEDRERLMAWSMKAIDVSDEERKVINKAKNRHSQERRRRKNGAKPQAQSERRTKPWEALGISESTFRRRKRKQRDSISSRPSLIDSTNDELLSPAPMSQPQGTAALPPASAKRHRPAPSGNDRATINSSDSNIIPFPKSKLPWSTPIITALVDTDAA